MVAVGGVGEPDGFVERVDDHVVDGVEGAGVEGADEAVCGVGGSEGGDEHDAVGAGVGEVALGAEEDAGLVVYAAVGEGEVGWGDVFGVDVGGGGGVVEAGEADGFGGGD